MQKFTFIPCYIFLFFVIENDRPTSNQNPGGFLANRNKCLDKVFHKPPFIPYRIIIADLAGSIKLLSSAPKGTGLAVAWLSKRCRLLPQSRLALPICDERFFSHLSWNKQPFPDYFTCFLHKTTWPSSCQALTYKHGSGIPNLYWWHFSAGGQKPHFLLWPKLEQHIFCENKKSCFFFFHGSRTSRQVTVTTQRHWRSSVRIAPWLFFQYSLHRPVKLGQSKSDHWFLEPKKPNALHPKQQIIPLLRTGFGPLRGP